MIPKNDVRNQYRKYKKAVVISFLEGYIFMNSFGTSTVRGFVFLLCFGLLSVAFAEEKPNSASMPQDSQNADSLQFNSIIIDNTITPAGRNFFQHFIDYWMVVYPSIKGIINLDEFPSVKDGSRITVLYENQVLHEVMVSQRSKNLDELAQAVANVVKSRLVNLQIQQAMTRGYDLTAPDEI